MGVGVTTGAPQIETFATKFGERAIACLGSGLLLLNYVGAISAALLTGGMFNTPLMVGAHAVLGACLVFQTWKLDQSEYTVDAIQGFYRFIWNLFYSVREKTASLSLSLPPAVESNTPTFTRLIMVVTVMRLATRLWLDLRKVIMLEADSPMATTFHVSPTVSLKHLLMVGGAMLAACS